MGRLTKQPENRGDNNKVCVFTIAVNRDFTNQSGEREADFIQIKAFKKLGENCSKFLTKGSLVAVEASIRTGKYDKDGKTVYTMEVIADKVKFLEGKRNGGTNSQQDNNQFNDDHDPFPGSTEINPDDDWPF